jgi:16S rRNA (uracil1498-N3)-methyltransferase
MADLVRVAVHPLEEGEQLLDAETAHYLVFVRRLRQGDSFHAFNPERELEACGTIVHVSGRRVTCRFDGVRPAARRAPHRVTLLQALGKGDKPEQVIRAATALGVERVVLLETERTVVRLDARAPARRERWRAVAVDAARQCCRQDLPFIDGPSSLEAALELLPVNTRCLCLHPEGGMALRAALDGWTPQEPLALLIGPEGGFTEAELRRADEASFRRVTLGPHVLRTEVAAVAVLGAVLALAET